MRTNTTTDGETIAGCILGIISLLVAIPATIFKGWVLTKLWGWFVVTQFHAPQLGIAQAIGLALTVGYLTKQYIREPKDDRRAWEIVLGGILLAFMWPSFALLFGWVVQHWTS